jgi:hypothetical protein
VEEILENFISNCTKIIQHIQIFFGGKRADPSDQDQISCIPVHTLKIHAESPKGTPNVCSTPEQLSFNKKVIHLLCTCLAECQ